MERNTWKEFEGKRIFVKLKTNSVYSGEVQEVNFLGCDDFGNEIWMFIIKDKFGKIVGFSSKEINLISEEK